MQAMNRIEVTKKMANNLNYLSDDEESEWLAFIYPSLLDKLKKKAEQLDDIQYFPWQFRSASHTSAMHSLLLNIRDIRPPRHNNLACWIINLLLDVLLCSIAENFYSLFVF